MRENPSYSDLQKYVAELEARVQKLENLLAENSRKTERLKRSFLANVSHELRTPMNAIMGFSNLIIDKNLSTDKQQEYMEHINVNGNHLLNIVDSMIDVSLLQINELKVKKENCNLSEILQQVYHFFNIDRHKNGKDHIAMLLNTGTSAKNLTIYTDSYRLTQVLSNLLHNALKYTNKGIIEFGCFVNNEDKLQFFVKDSGKGILAEKAQSIFDKFGKLDENENAQDRGLGLGLTLSKGIVNLLGGEIWVESNIFKGSTFNFTIDYTFSYHEMSAQRRVLHSILI
jgi:signal transduction histidine kinase